MKRMSVHEAKARFSAVLKEVAAGETVIVTKHDKPVAEIRAVEEKPKRVFGAFKGQIEMPEEGITWSDEELYEMWGEEYGFEKPTK